MKKSILYSLCFAMSVFLFSGTAVQAQDKGAINHVLLVWLKEPGNAEMRRQFVENSKELNKLPGIINRQVGMVKVSERKIVDSSFDVAVTVTVKDQAAFDAYMNAPLHKKIVDEKLKPLISRVVAYDFVSE